MPRSSEHPTQSTYELFDAFQQVGCPVCFLALRGVSHFMESMNYDSVGDQTFRTQLKEALGFCNTHAYQWLRSAFLLGTAEIYRDILQIFTESLGNAAPQSVGTFIHFPSLFHHDSTGAGVTVIRPTASCPACAHVDRTESMLVRTLIEGLPNRTFRTAYEASSGLCIPHLRMALAVSSVDTSDVLVNHALKVEEIMLTQLGEIIRKHDYRYRDEPIGDEKGAAERAVRHVAGAKNITKLQIL